MLLHNEMQAEIRDRQERARLVMPNTSDASDKRLRAIMDFGRKHNLPISQESILAFLDVRNA